MQVPCRCERIERDYCPDIASTRSGALKRLVQAVEFPSFGLHSHRAPYAAVVLAGGYEEAGDQGLFRVRVGDVLFHERFESHRNTFYTPNTIILNFPLPVDRCAVGIAHLEDLDSVVRLAQENKAAAAALLLSRPITRWTEQADWPDALASALIRDHSLSLSSWSQAMGLSPWTVSRGFAQVFGISPSSFRARARARAAWRAIRMSDDPLASIAADLGFADQAHMTRSVKQLTGSVPQEWRRHAKGFKTPAPVRCLNH
jgi:AraC-like DNA-binding protein